MISVPFSFKETLGDESPVGAPLTLYHADPERTRRLAGLATRFARLGRVPNAQKKVAVLLSNYPTKALARRQRRRPRHPSRARSGF